jgi:hypothetical protein
VVACRKAEQPGECEDAEETETVPVTAVKGVNGDRVPDSKLVAAAVVPGYGSVGAGVPGWQVGGAADAGPAAKEAITSGIAIMPAKQSLKNRYIGRPSNPCVELDIMRVAAGLGIERLVRTSTAAKETLRATTWENLECPDGPSPVFLNAWRKRVVPHFRA